MSFPPELMSAAARSLPDLIVFGVGHSGTSIVTRMLFELGWRSNSADEQFCEPPKLRELNQRLLALDAEADAPAAEMRAFLDGLEHPFALKDPRLVVTLPRWMPVLSRGERWPVLLWITRSPAPLEASYAARGERVGAAWGAHGRTVEALVAEAERQFENWPGAKLELAYERIARAAGLFLVEPGAPHPLGGLWQ